MGLRGPPPKPTALKLLQGNPGKRPIRAEPKPAPVAPVCPKWLPREAKAAWRQLAPRLERLGLLTEVDGQAFSALCSSWWLVIAAIRAMKEDEGQRNQLKDAMGLFRGWCREFGLTPAARVGLPAQEPSGPDDLLDS